MGAQKRHGASEMHAEDQTAKRPVSRPSPIRKERQVFTEKAGLFKIAGIGKSKNRGGFSWRKHEIV